MSTDYYHEFAPPGKLALFQRARVGDMGRYTGLLDSSGEKILPIEELLASFNADGVIRLRRTDFDQALLLKERLITFNLGRVTNEIGKRYLVIAIASPGFKDENVEVLPVLDPKDARVGLCTEVRQEVPIESISEDDFNSSIESIRNIEMLKNALFERYSKFNRELTREQLLSRGCALTTIDFIRNTDQKSSR